MPALENESQSVCVSWWHLVSPYLKWRQVSLSVSISFSSACLCSSKMTSIDNAPLSFKTEVMVGFSNLPVCSWFLRTSTSTSPRISPCKSLRGRRAARQQEKDQYGFLRHSLMKQHRNKAYWTESKQDIEEYDQSVTNRKCTSQDRQITKISVFVSEKNSNNTQTCVSPVISNEHCIRTFASETPLFVFLLFPFTELNSPVTFLNSIYPGR